MLISKTRFLFQVNMECSLTVSKKLLFEIKAEIPF